MCLPVFSNSPEILSQALSLMFYCGVHPWIYSRGMDISSPLQLIVPGTLLRMYTTHKLNETYFWTDATDKKLRISGCTWLHGVYCACPSSATFKNIATYQTTWRRSDIANMAYIAYAVLCGPFTLSVKAAIFPVHSKHSVHGVRYAVCGRRL